MLTQEMPDRLVLELVSADGYYGTATFRLTDGKLDEHAPVMWYSEPEKQTMSATFSIRTADGTLKAILEVSGYVWRDIEGFYDLEEFVLAALTDGNFERAKHLVAEEIREYLDEASWRRHYKDWYGAATGEEATGEDEEPVATLTAAQAAAYVQEGGHRCPFCGSEELDPGKMQADGPIAWQKVTCEDCGREWIDEYSLTGVRAA